MKRWEEKEGENAIFRLGHLPKIFVLTQVEIFFTGSSPFLLQMLVQLLPEHTILLRFTKLKIYFLLNPEILNLNFFPSQTWMEDAFKLSPHCCLPFRELLPPLRKVTRRGESSFPPSSPRAQWAPSSQKGFPPAADYSPESQTMHCNQNQISRICVLIRFLADCWTDIQCQLIATIAPVGADKLGVKRNRHKHMYWKQFSRIWMHANCTNYKH